MTRGAADRQRSAERYFEISLLGLLASGYLAVVGSGYLDQPTALVTLACIAVRAWIVVRGKTVGDTSRWSDILTLAYIGFFPLDYYYISKDFISATVHMVFFTACQKLLFGWKDRDYAYLKIIAFMELLAAAILSASANFFVFLAFFVLFGVATFAAGEIRRSLQQQETVVRSGMKGFGGRLTALTTLTVLGILGLTSGLFFMLPRTARAAFQHLIPSRYHLPGFANEVTLGQIGELKADNAAVMHLRFIDGPARMPSTLSLKWRGMALSQFDGRRWYNTSSIGEPLRTERGLAMLVPPEHRHLPGRRIDYEVQLKNVASNTLFFAGVPEYVRINVPFLWRTKTNNYRFSNSGMDRLRYAAGSWFNGWSIGNGSADLAADLTPEQTQEFLRLPALDPRIERLAQEAIGRAPLPPEVRAFRIESYLRKAYGYTTQLPDRQEKDPLAYFLFERRKGHCEYFASSMAVMLRTLGIPSRVVTGFQGGTLNPMNGWYIVRASDAHSWVEAWFPNRGWLTFDPTPPDPNAAAPPWWSKVNFYLDAMDVFWQDWVLSYDLDRQLTLASRVEESRRTMNLEWLENGARRGGEIARAAVNLGKRYALVVLGVLALVALVIGAGPGAARWWQHRRRHQRVKAGRVQPGDATLLYERLLELLRNRGYEKPNWLTPQEFAAVLPQSTVRLIVCDFTAAYNELRFGGNKDAAPRMVALLEQLETASPASSRTA